MSIPTSDSELQLLKAEIAQHASNLAALNQRIIIHSDGIRDSIDGIRDSLKSKPGWEGYLLGVVGTVLSVTALTITLSVVFLPDKIGMHIQGPIQELSSKIDNQTIEISRLVERNSTYSSILAEIEASDKLLKSDIGMLVGDTIKINKKIPVLERAMGESDVLAIALDELDNFRTEILSGAFRHEYLLLPASRNAYFLHRQIADSSFPLSVSLSQQCDTSSGRSQGSCDVNHGNIELNESRLAQFLQEVSPVARIVVSGSPEAQQFGFSDKSTPGLYLIQRTPSPQFNRYTPNAQKAGAEFFSHEVQAALKYYRDKVFAQQK